MSANIARQMRRQVVYNHIREAIEKGNLKPGQFISGTRDLERELSVSHHAATKGMEQLVKEGWIVRKVGVGTYVRAPDATSLPFGAKAISIDLQALSIQRERFLLPCLEAIKQELEKRGCRWEEHKHYDDVGDVMPPVAPEGCDAAIYLLPQVLPNFTLPFSLIMDDPFVITESGQFDVVTPDNFQGGVLAGAYLKEQKCDIIKFVGVGRSAGELDNISKLRLAGCQSALGRSISTENIIALKMGYHLIHAMRESQRIFSGKKGRMGIFCASDDLAMGLVHSAATLGITLGSDVALVGFDAQPQRFEGDPPLTTVMVPLKEMGRCAACMLLERLADPTIPCRKLSLQCTFRVGKT